MKKIALLVFASLFTVFANAQETYNVNGQKVELKTAVSGELNLLWSLVDKQYHYFVKKNDSVLVELHNTKTSNRVYAEEYKTTLKNLTGDKVDFKNVDFTLASLARAIDSYNLSVDPNYVSMHSKFDSSWRLGIFGGISNSPFVSNPNNEKAAVFGAEVEMLIGKNKRHSGYFQLRHVSQVDEFIYKTTELSLGYRYRFINSSRISLYGDVKFATLNFTNASVTYFNSATDVITKEINDTAFDLPLIVGIGADFQISPRIYANLSYNQLFSVLLKNQGNFSTDITAGLKFKFN